MQPEPTKLCSKAFLSHRSVWISLAKSLHWVLGFLLRSIDFNSELRKASLSRSKLRKTSVLFGKTLRARGYVDKRVDQSGFHKSMCFTGRDRMSVNISISRERLRRVLRKKAAVILHLHTFTSADLHLHTFTSADLLHTLTPADLDLHTFTSSHPHICRSTSSHPHMC